MLEVNGLNAWYGPAQALFDVALSVGENEVVALLGRNGAGKSTTLKSLIGVAPRAAGAVRFDGADILGARPHAIARRGLAYAPEDRRIFDDLTVLENLEVGRRIDGPGPAWTLDRLFALFPNLAERRRLRGGRLSGGEKQMLVIARALMGRPRMLLLDEPSEGVAPIIVERMAAMIATLKRDGLSVLLCEQNMRFARAAADRVLIMESGAVRFSGRFADLDADPSIAARRLAV